MPSKRTRSGVDRPNSKRTMKFEIGAIVETNHTNNGWYLSTIRSQTTNGLYEIYYHATQKKELDVPSSRIRIPKNIGRQTGPMYVLVDS